MSYDQIFMPFPEPQQNATFLERPQRFLAKIAFEDGSQTLAYCANPGSLHGCLQAGSSALLWDSQDIKRKRRYTLRAVEFDGVWVGTDTHLANRLIEEALRARILPSFERYETVERERLIGEGFRVDFLLAGIEGLCFVEVKSATVVEKGVARFPDSITPRGVKHLKEMARKASEGHRAVLIYLVQRNDVESFTINENIYPAYAMAFKEATVAGVESFAFSVPVSPRGFGKLSLLPINL